MIWYPSQFHDIISISRINFPNSEALKALTNFSAAKHNIWHFCIYTYNSSIGSFNLRIVYLIARYLSKGFIFKSLHFDIFSLHQWKFSRCLSGLDFLKSQFGRLLQTQNKIDFRTNLIFCRVRTWFLLPV